MKLGKHAASIALIVAAAGLAAYVLVVDRDKVTDVERAARPKNVFPAFRRDDVSRVVLQSDKERLAFERSVASDAGDREWRMTQPRAEVADAAEADKLLGALEFATFVRKVDAAAAAGPPRVRGSITMGKLVVEFQLGQPAPSPEGASYFSVAGEGTFVVPKELAAQLLKTADDYRSKSFVPYLSIDLARLEVASDAQRYAIERIDEVAFKFADTGLRVSRDRLDRVWLALGEMHADAFLPDADDQHPQFVVRMLPKDGGRPVGELAVVGECPGIPNDLVVVRRSPSRLVACVPKVVAEGLSTKRDELIDTRLFAAHEDEVESLSLAALPSGLKIDLARKGSGWRLQSPEDRDLSSDEAETTLALASAIARGAGDGVAKGLACPASSRVTLTRAESHAEERVEVGTCADGRVVAVRAADGAGLVLAPELARKLTPRLSSLRGRAAMPSSVAARDVSKVSLRCGCAQDLSRTGAGFQLGAPAGYAVDQAGAVDVVDALIRARADAWVSDTDEPAFGLSGSQCGASLEVRGDGEVRVFSLRFGNEGEGGVYARIDETGGAPSPVFVAPLSLRAAASRIVIDRSALSIDPARAESITLTQGPRSVALTRHQGRLLLAGGGTPPNPDELARGLAQLRADDVVHLGPAREAEGFGAPALVIDARVDRGSGVAAVRITFGRASLRAHQNMLFARVTGVDATFAVAEDRLRPLLGAL